MPEKALDFELSENYVVCTVDVNVIAAWLELWKSRCKKVGWVFLLSPLKVFKEEIIGMGYPLYKTIHICIFANFFGWICTTES